MSVHSLSVTKLTYPEHCCSVLLSVCKQAMLMLACIGPGSRSGPPGLSILSILPTAFHSLSSLHSWFCVGCNSSACRTYRLRFFQRIFQLIVFAHEMFAPLLRDHMFDNELLAHLRHKLSNESGVP